MTHEQRELRAGFRLVAGCAVALSLSAGGAGAQQLWSVEEATAQPVQPIMMEGVAVNATVTAGAPTAEAATVQVTFDYLRLGMGYLELPLPDGSVIEAENAVFEYRGGGNLVWAGEVPGAGYESVLFTVQDGHLVGWFGEPGGPKYVVHAGPDGRGSLAEEVGPTGDWCGVEAGPSRDFVHDVAQAQDRRVSVASQLSDDRLDILVLYTTGTEKFWRVIGGPAVGIRQLGDYLNMVFRNGAIPATANLIAEPWNPGVFNSPRRQGGHYPYQRESSFLPSAPWHDEFKHSLEVNGLRLRHKPDLVHFIPEVGVGGTAGRAAWRISLDPYVNTGWSTPYPSTFAHEVGHNLGGQHEPVTFGDEFEKWQAVFAENLRPYVFGHTDLTSCAKREGRGDWLWCPTTIMSYGQDLWHDPERFGAEEPFYSSVRHKPNGWTIGVAGTSEVERLFFETVPVQARSGEEPEAVLQLPQIDVHWTGKDQIQVAFPQPVNGSARVWLALPEGSNEPRHLNGPDSTSVGVSAIRNAEGLAIGAEIAGLRPGGHYRIAVDALPLYDFSQRNHRTVSSEVFYLQPPRQAAGSPEAATGVGARATGPNSIRLHWRDNSSVETGYEVWYREWSGDKPDYVWQRYGEPLAAGTRHVDVDGLAAEESVLARTVLPAGRAQRGRYSFVVLAYNDKGRNASETFDLEFMPGPHPKPTTPGELTDCYWRPTGIDLDGYQVEACLETPDGARRRAWDYRLEADQSGLLYFFDRDNAEILVKVLNGCAINGHRWVFLAPVTTLPFRLRIREVGPYIVNRRQVWYYDSERRSQDRIQRDSGGRVGNPSGRTARTVSDTTAFPCTAAEIAARKASLNNGSEARLRTVDLAVAASPMRLRAGSATDCEPGGPTLTLRGGYTVSMCYETYEGEVGDARDWGLDSSQSGLMYFFERNNAEVLIKVLDGCGVNGHRWVFVAPVTDLAFNLVVESPDGQRWTHSNRLGQTADAASDVSAFPCSSSA